MPDIRRIARQHLVTSRLLGVDFIPVRVQSVPYSPGAAPGQERGSAEKTRESGSTGVIQVIQKPSQSRLMFEGDAQTELDPAAKGSALEELRERHAATCPHCTSVTGCLQTVFGEGDPNAALMFLGEAPGEEEDRTGRPFVGRAGKKLDDMIRAMGLRREQVYIANVLKSRPPNNRTPLPTEVEGCSPFLAEQIRIIRPALIVGLGGPAAKWLLRTSEGITRIRGQLATYLDEPLSVTVMPTFHPAYVLRNYTVDTRQKVWSDLQAVMAFLRESGRWPEE